MTDRLKGTKAVITGGAGAIGMATARAFLAEGAEVFVTDYDEAMVARAVEALRAEAKPAFVNGAAADVTAADAVGAMMAQAMEAMGGMSALINNAGTNARGNLTDLSPGDIDRVIDVNTKGVILCTQAAIPHLQGAKNATVTSTASQAGKRGWAQIAVYCASKAAVIGFSRAMAVELAPAIRVNSIAPGHIKDEGMAWDGFAERKSAQQSLDDFSAEFAAAEIPLRRLQSAADIANGFVFLTSREASEITGEVLNIGGGVVMD
ncbi:MAG: SDR family NAD(P)-dependent oxidoreductase [Rhodospirillaceae bacterium]|nr:SDR family NAD(P)-dependent oxidoreductase [Rhodospirillaceae bacterium]MDD9913563.1 SDR family NAD(P)-dependent oxidoreductase [Rhodospirillaceae bacterium]MDD9927335.1 SDR family NAD(P)-dependent oxidoreductase [Rhodospirillaceae bacterium]